eukprot:s4399_g3.t1
MGVFEMEAFEKGTKQMMETIVSVTKDGAVSVIGGGDTATACKKYDTVDKELKACRDDFLRKGLAKRHHSVASAALAKCSRANLVDSFAAWKETIRSEMLAHLKHELLRTKNSLKLFEKELEEAKQRRREELVSRFMSTSTSIKSNFLKAWRLQVEERTRRQLSHEGTEIATRGDASLQADVLAGWVREVGKGRAAKATQQQQQALLRRLASTMAESRKSVLQAWRHWLEAQKTARRRLMQGHARAARQMADNDQPLLMLLFQGFRMLLVERRMRVQAAKECGIYKKRAVGRDRASAEQLGSAPSGQDNALLSRATLGWMMLTSVSGAVAQERRRLARTAGLGRANARNPGTPGSRQPRA